jgi:hypothetical protein
MERLAQEKQRTGDDAGVVAEQQATESCGRGDNGDMH